MRWSNLFIPTLRDAPADAEAKSHKLLVRAGYIRQLHAGHYSLLPLGLKVHAKIAQVIRHEMDAIGCQEFQLPTMHPSWVWERSGRWQTMGDEMFRLKDRKGADLALGMTAEEVFALLATELVSYRQLPQMWYQIHTKFRDEPRPKAGLLRVREFAMKDAYSFNESVESRDASFDTHHAAYQRIFARLGLDAFGVEASSGAMGGSGSIEFMVPSPAGEDDVVRCPQCGYAANVERASSRLDPVEDADGATELERFATPGVVTIAALEQFEGGAPADRQIKSLLMFVDGELTVVAMRGDHQLNPQKLADALGASEVRPAEAEEIFAALGAHPGSLGPVGVSELRIVADEALRGRRSMTTGANEDGWHFRGVDIERDVNVREWLDLREVRAGEACVQCGEAIEVVRCIEVGHIFKLGTKYSEAMDARFLDDNGESHPIIMGSYGIGIGRAVAAVAEQMGDDKGLVWPMLIAPYEVGVIAVNLKDADSTAEAERIYADLAARGVDVTIDDRDVRPGVKFADHELIGTPLRVTVGPKGLAAGEIELFDRRSGEPSTVPVADAVEAVFAMVTDGRAATAAVR